MSTSRAKTLIRALFLLSGLWVPTMRSPLTAQELAPNGADDTCRTCHEAKVTSYFDTAHHLTSRVPTKESILGSFADDRSTLRTANPALSFQMESRPDGFYEMAVWASPAKNPGRTERIDVVVGSGRVGQTYLYWQNDRLFQLPVSYWVDLASWVNSPGYRDGTANFDRPVVPRCLECHATYAAGIGPPSSSNQYRRESLVFGISCERCHGPAGQHVEAMATKNAAPGIVKLTAMPRDRQIDVCAQCHGGRRFPVRASFSYGPGEQLDDFYVRDQAKPGASVDVHGNQVALLQMSRCYQASAQLTCSTCHDVHKTQRDAAAFSSHCLECHRAEQCGEYPKLRERIQKDCVDCHMPVQASSLIISNSNGKQTRAMVRSHWIKVYADSTKAVSLR